MRIQQRLWQPHLVVGIGSAMAMVIELVASRMIAPRVGVSLHTWTAVIGVALAGASIGNYVGGRLADRRPTFGVLGYLFGAAALACLGTLWLNNDLHEMTFGSGTPLMVWILFYVGGVFMPASIFLGTISPLVAKRSLDDLGRAGRTVGGLYAASVAGSILGTFATGFLLINAFGTKATMLGVSAVLLLMGVWFLSAMGHRRGLIRVALVTAVYGSGIWFLHHEGHLSSECLDETDYFCINVNDSEVNGHPVRELLLDRLVHSYTDLEDPTRLLYGYERTYAGLLEPMMKTRPTMRAFFIGGGGYTFPRYVEAKLPKSTVVVAEIDPGVTEIAHQELGLPRDTSIQTINLDARNVLTWSTEPGSYDVVFGDAFNDFSVPFHLTTREFDQLVKRSLADNGLYLVNIIDGGKYGHFFRAYVRTLRSVFAHVVVIPSQDGWRESVRTTYVLAASMRPLDLGQLTTEFAPLTEAELDEYLSEEPGAILTDDYVPVDNLMAPVVEGSFFSAELPEGVEKEIAQRVIVIGGAALALLVAAVAVVSVRLLRRRRAHRSLDADQ